MTTLLPPNSTSLETAVDLAVAKSIETIPERGIYNQWHPDTCPEPLLGYLAWAVSVDDWSPDWDSKTKRAVIAASLKVHQHKGTLAAVHRVLAALGVVTEIREYPETPVPHTIEAIAYAHRPLSGSVVLLDQASIETVQRNLEFVKPARTTVGLKLGVGWSTDLMLANMSYLSGLHYAKATVLPNQKVQGLSGLGSGFFGRIGLMQRLSAAADSDRGCSGIQGLAVAVGSILGCLHRNTAAFLPSRASFRNPVRIVAASSLGVLYRGVASLSPSAVSLEHQIDLAAASSARSLLRTGTLVHCGPQNFIQHPAFACFGQIKPLLRISGALS